MNETRIVRLHYLLRAGILLALAGLLARWSSRSELQLYVTPETAGWVKLCPIPIAAMAAVLTYQALFGRPELLCDCERPLPRSPLRIGSAYALFLLPLLFGLLLPNQALGSTAAAQKGMAFVSAPAAESREREDSRFAASPYLQEFTDLAQRLQQEQIIPIYPSLFSETLGAIDLYKSEFAGREVRVTGFLYPGDAADPEGRFAVGRFLVQCCTADAAPLGILVKPPTPNSLPADTWIQVQGKLEIAGYQGAETVQIAAERITVVPEPSEPYVYTSPDSVEEWDRLRQEARAANSKQPPGL
ncbi:TIGR03943 family putative permease subunit [Paenibacillus sp. CN-4]|uniref:TIGR03943 family putative permease subunit n=1 Tax=Paenibacillus nanchangensis TaxID=3348343 RepID=UPI00397BC066